MVKIGFLHKVNTTPPRGGGTVHTYQISHYLAKQGHQLLTLAPEQGSQFTQRLPRSIAGLRSLVRSADLLYIRIDGRVGWELMSLLPGWLKTDQPVIWEINATLDELAILPGPKRWRDRLGAPLRPLSAQRASTALCVSEPLVHYAHDLGIESAILVPNGSDPQLFRPAQDSACAFAGLENCFRVLWAGSTSYNWHDFATVLACAHKMQNLDPEISFVIVGDRPDLAEQLPQNLHFYPPVLYQDAPRLFASAHVGLCLYQDLSWSQYGFFFSPLKLFDYAASGLPIIYTNFPELHRIAANFGLSVGVGDVDALTAQILALKQQYSLYERLAQNARQAVIDYYNWDRVGAQTEAAILTLLGQTPQSKHPQFEQSRQLLNNDISV
ncbi:glycosyltransferase [Leptolyngbya sp. FACHB-261]|uniref:glycosyltransferase n=1 Tax=Leptolyngbya sp. FACHB-261 TaxID=2692806 RepID=UPI001681C76B|nr:glycosyltransferase [Leptolyngbya sp. FACHB-261]MBD2105039.1 glycosyltransferase [Leptolyngbya sp. FACHB-261]